MLPLSLVVLCLSVLEHSAHATSPSLHAIAIKNRDFVKYNPMLEPQKVWWSHQETPEREALKICAELAASHNVDKFLLSIIMEHGFGNQANLCLVFSSKSSYQVVTGERRRFIAECLHDTDCTSLQDFRISRNYDCPQAEYTAGEFNLSKSECLDRIVRINLESAVEDVIENVEWKQDANGVISCAVPVLGSTTRYTMKYVGTIASSDYPSFPRDLSCSNPFVNGADLHDCVSFSWDKPKGYDNLWSKLYRWRSLPATNLPNIPDLYRPTPPTLYGKPDYSTSLEFKLLRQTKGVRLDTDAFYDHVRVIHGPPTVYHYTITALEASEAIKLCAAEAQKRFYRTFSVDQYHSGWRCSLIWEELKNLDGLMVKDDEVIWGIVYSASLNTTNMKPS